MMEVFEQMKTKRIALYPLNAAVCLDDTYLQGFEMHFDPAKDSIAEC